MADRGRLFCSRIHVGEVRDLSARPKPCCKIQREESTFHLSDADYRKYLAVELKSGVEVKDCEACWVRERAGQRSYRHQGDDLVTDLEKEKLMNDPYIKLPIRHLEIILSNVCNFACQMCGPALSTKWQSLIKKKKVFKNSKVYWNNPSDLRKKSNSYTDDELKGVRVIKLMGGEPFHAKETGELLERIDSLGIAPNMRLETPTNCSTFPTLRQQEILSKFEKLDICTSFDGVRELNDWIRYGSKWDVVIKNFEKWLEFCETHRSPETTVSISNTVTVLNVNRLAEFYRFFGQYFSNLGRISSFPAFHPDHLSIRNLREVEVEPWLGELGSVLYGSGKQHGDPMADIRARAESRIMSGNDIINLRYHVDQIKKLTGKSLLDINPEMGRVLQKYMIRSVDKEVHSYRTFRKDFVTRI